MKPNSKTTLDGLVKEAGVKDAFAQPLLDALVQLSNTLWNSDDGITYSTLQDLLTAELRRMKSLGPIHNPLLDMKGMQFNFEFQSAY
jgi:hypothetical protein